MGGGGLLKPDTGEIPQVLKGKVGMLVELYCT